MIKSLKIPAVSKGLPCHVAQAPAHFELKIATIPSMAQQLVYEPLLILWCPEVIRFGVHPVQKQCIIGSVVQPQQRHVEHRVYTSILGHSRQLQSVRGRLWPRLQHLPRAHKLRAEFPSLPFREVQVFGGEEYERSLSYVRILCMMLIRTFCLEYPHFDNGIVRICKVL